MIPGNLMNFQYSDTKPKSIKSSKRKKALQKICLLERLDNNVSKEWTSIVLSLWDLGFVSNNRELRIASIILT